MTDGDSAARLDRSACAEKDWGRWRDYRSTVFLRYPDAELVACGTCGRPCDKVKSSRPLCDGCWEVEYRLDAYLRDGGAAAARFLIAALEGEPLRLVSK
jgi:hypothetical protein